MDDFNAFGRLLDALRPWLGHVVIVGGWAHRLHRFHPLSHPPNVAAHEKPRKSGRTSIGTAGGTMPVIVEISACARPRVSDRTPLPWQ